MPELNKEYPIALEEWEVGTPEEFKTWVLHIADQYLWSTDDRAYNFFSTLAILLEKNKWTYAMPGITKVEPVSVTEVALDVRKFAVQKASEILSFDIIESEKEATALVNAAKTIEAFILGTN